MKIPAKVNYTLVAALVVISFLLLLFGFILWPKPAKNVTENFDDVMQIGDYSVSVSSAKIDISSGEISLNLYHMTAEPDTFVNGFFISAYANEDRRKTVTIQTSEIDPQNRSISITNAPDSWAALSIEINGYDLDGQPVTKTITIDRRDFKTFDKTQLVYVYVTATPAATAAE